MNISRMCSGNFYSAKNRSFKSNSKMSKKEFYKIKSDIRKEEYNKQDKINAAAAAIGAITWVCAGALKANKPFEKGFGAYIASGLALAGLDYYKHINDKTDLGNEEKTKQYQQMLKEETDEDIKHCIIPSVITGCLTAAITAAVCYKKNLADKLDKIIIAPMVALTASFFVTGSNLAIRRNNEIKIEEQNKN